MPKDGFRLKVHPRSKLNNDHDMDSSTNVACGFLGGTIFSVDGGYRVLQHPRQERVFQRLSDARWFLAVTWCDQCPTPSGILTHDGQLSFYNQAALSLGETTFLPPEHRNAIFQRCLSLKSGESTVYEMHPADYPLHTQVEILGVEIDPRYGKVAIVRTVEAHQISQRSRG